MFVIIFFFCLNYGFKWSLKKALLPPDVSKMCAIMAGYLLPIVLLERYLGNKKKVSMDDLATVIFSFSVLYVTRNGFLPLVGAAHLGRRARAKGRTYGAAGGAESPRHGRHSAQGPGAHTADLPLRCRWR